MNTYRSQTFLNLEQGTGIGTTVAVTKFTIPVIGVPLLGIYRRNKQIIRPDEFQVWSLYGTAVSARGAVKTKHDSHDSVICAHATRSASDGLPAKQTSKP